jgi:CRISPR system Cascade subunit CasB
MTTENTATTTDPLKNQREFLQALYKRVDRDNGAKADFKRALSGEPQHYRKIYEFVLYKIGGFPKWEQDHIWIPVACLAVFYPQPLEDQENKLPRNFGDSCRKLAAKKDSKGPERRFRALLDTSLEDIRSPLTALVRQMKAESVAINYPQLLADLKVWEDYRQKAQDRWARSFWQALSTEGESSEAIKQGDSLSTEDSENL